jgi:hypothetical protein
MEEPEVLPTFALDKWGQARLLATVRRPVTGVFNSYSVLAGLADEAGAAGRGGRGVAGAVTSLSTVDSFKYLYKYLYL